MVCIKRTIQPLHVLNSHILLMNTMFGDKSVVSFIHTIIINMAAEEDVAELAMGEHMSLEV